MRESHRNSDALLVRLSEYIGKLEGGVVSIGEFNTWFMNASWEARMAADSAALRLGWRIQNLLYQWQDSPEAFTNVSLGTSLRRSWLQFAADSTSEWPSLAEVEKATLTA
ncbi:MAG: hypothetical protein KF883_10705 [Thermomicrobiales bacterium]|nr:hypothetical protein [Thermomicrobiales bacterium]